MHSTLNSERDGLQHQKTTLLGLMSLSFCCDIWNAIWRHGSVLPYINSSGCLWWCNGMVDFFLGTLGIKWICSKAAAYINIVPEHVHPLWQQCTHLLTPVSIRIIRHATKFNSTQTSFLTMTMLRNQLQSNSLHSHQSSFWHIGFVFYLNKLNYAVCFVSLYFSKGSF